MKREILFRAKAINRVDGREYKTNYKNGDWVYGLVSRLYDERFENLPAEMTNTNGISNIDVDYKTVGQYTDLNDRDGKKIFEGDIVKDNDGYRYVVLYYGEAGYPAFDLANWDGECNGLAYYTQGGSSLKVIGNIYDNPEMLGNINKPVAEDAAQPVLKPATEPPENFQIMNG